MSPKNRDHELVDGVMQWLDALAQPNPAPTKVAVGDAHDFAVQMALRHLTDLYRLTVLVVKFEPDTDRVARWWELMAHVCENHHRALALNLGPQAGQPALADMVKLRDRCREFCDLHRRG